MTLQQKFNWGSRACGVLVFAAFLNIGVSLWTAGFDARHEDEGARERASQAAMNRSGGLFVLVFIATAGISWFWGRCPDCKTSYTYRKPDMDGTKNRSYRADNHCHKCGYSFTGGAPK